MKKNSKIRIVNTPQINVKMRSRKSNMINLNSNLVSGRTLSGAAAAGVTKVTEDISEQVHESPTYFSAAKYIFN